MHREAPSGPVPGHDELVAAGVNLVHEATAAEVVGALRDAGVRSILLKGPAVIRWLYPEITDRFSVDVDVLVSSEEVGQAGHALAELGFEPSEPLRDDRHAWSLTRLGDGMDVDLHRTLVGVGATDADAWQLLSERTETQELGGISVELLAEPARALHLALHAAQETADKSKALRDLERGLELLPTETWREAGVLAVRLEAEPAFATGLRLSTSGRVQADILDLPDVVTAEVALRAGTPPALSLGINRMLDLQGRRRVTYAARRAFPPPDAVRVWSPLARKGNAGLAAAYVWRAVWLATRVAPAIKAVRAARAKARTAGRE